MRGSFRVKMDPLRSYVIVVSLNFKRFNEYDETVDGAAALKS
jgi:hypothetical protein